MNTKLLHKNDVKLGVFMLIFSSFIHAFLFLYRHGLFYAQYECSDLLFRLRICQDLINKKRLDFNVDEVAAAATKMQAICAIIFDQKL